MTPKTKASPTPTGKATDIPHTAIAADSRMLDALKIIPPSNALPILEKSACLRSVRKLRPFSPWLPRVKAKNNAQSTIPNT